MMNNITCIQKDDQKHIIYKNFNVILTIKLDLSSDMTIIGIPPNNPLLYTVQPVLSNTVLREHLPKARFYMPKLILH